MSAGLTPLILVQRGLRFGWERIGGVILVAGLALIVTAIAICGLLGLIR